MAFYRCGSSGGSALDKGYVYGNKGFASLGKTAIVNNSCLMSFTGMHNAYGGTFVFANNGYSTLQTTSDVSNNLYIYDITDGVLNVIGTYVNSTTHSNIPIANKDIIIVSGITLDSLGYMRFNFS